MTKAMNLSGYRSAMLSHVGRVRKNNEDFCAESREHGIFVVCDGMGGAAAGEVASKLAADTFILALSLARGGHGPDGRGSAEARMDAAVRAANQAVFQHSRKSDELHGMGTTLVGLLLEVSTTLPEMPELTLVHVGDSRCYRFRAGALELLTQDHSLVEEQLRLGEISAFEAHHHPMRNIITRAVGSHPLVLPEVRRVDALRGDLYLLASDGLTRELSDAEIARIVELAVSRASDGQLDLEALCQALVDEANDAGGGDNVTVLLLQMG
jgi:protein phosphatase